MDLYVTYTEAEINDASERKLQIVNDYLTGINRHLSNIKRRILIDDNTLLSMIAALNAGFNVILYGPPGTAKSTISGFLPVEFYGAKCNVHTADSDWNVRKVIGGITVTYDTSTTPIREQIGPKDGYIVEDILECYESRLETADFDTVFTVIDEFNRTNMDECLGPMFTAMGSDDKTLKLDYNKGFNDDFLQVKVPNGYRMICNMNKYDRTFTNELSEALARRFKWIYVGAPTASDYGQEERLVDGNVFGTVTSILPVTPVNLVDIEECENSPLFEACITSQIYAVINDLRTDLEVGTSYKIDAIRLANHMKDNYPDEAEITNLFVAEAAIGTSPISTRIKKFQPSALKKDALYTIIFYALDQYVRKCKLKGLRTGKKIVDAEVFLVEFLDFLDDAFEGSLKWLGRIKAGEDIETIKDFIATTLTADQRDEIFTCIQNAFGLRIPMP